MGLTDVISLNYFDYLPHIERASFSGTVDISAVYPKTLLFFLKQRKNLLYYQTLRMAHAGIKGEECLMLDKAIESLKASLPSE